MAEFVTCSQDSVVFWDYKSFSSKRSTQPFSGAGYHVQSAYWSASNSKLMVAPKWGDCIVWCEPANDPTNWNTIWDKDGGHFTCGCLMSNSRYLLSGSSDGLLKLWDIKNKSSTKMLEGHDVPVAGVASSSNDQLVLSGGQDGRLLLHSLSSSHTLQSTVTLSHADTISQGAITRVRFSVMDRAMAATASENGCVCLWSVESQRLLHTFPSSSPSGPTNDLCFAQNNNKLLVSVGQDCKIHFLDTQQRKEVMLVSSPSPLSSVAILRDGYTVAVGGVDGKLYIYELRAMKSSKHVLDAHQGAVTCIAEQNSAKSSRSSLKRGSTHSSRKSVKESSKTSVATPSSDASGSTPGTVKDSQPAPTTTTTTTLGSVISPLVPSNDTSGEPSQPLPVVFQAPTVPRPAVTGTCNLPHQTPFAAPRSGVQWAQFTTPAQTANDKDSTGIFSPVDLTMSTPHPLPTSTDHTHPLTTSTDHTHPLTTSTDGTHPWPLANTTGSDISSKTALSGQRHQFGSLAVQDARGYPLVSTFVSSTPAMKQPPLGMSGIFSPLDSTTPAILGEAGVAVGGRWHVVQDIPPATTSAATPALGAVSEVRSPATIVGGKTETDGDVASTTSPHTLPTIDTAASGSQTSLSSHSSKESTSMFSQPQQPQPLSQHGRHHLTTTNSSVDPPYPVPTAEQLSSRVTHHQPQANPLVQLPPHPQPTATISDAAGVNVAPTLGTSSIHLQYLEKLIRDSNDELRHATHRDIRALGLDMFRQFLILQQQVGTAVSALHEKIERLSEENKHLQEQLHQYAPKY